MIADTYSGNLQRKRDHSSARTKETATKRSRSRTTASTGYVCSGTKRAWWQIGPIYHCYPKSFKDSNDDGIGDLKGEKMSNRVGSIFFFSR